jgi:hypothetical protein
MAAACSGVGSTARNEGGVRAYLEELHLLVLAEDKLGCFAPVRSMLPAMLDQARRVAVNLYMQCVI